jgi:hypothetical protein
MITIGFSSHHAEILPYARKHMQQHQMIVLEEPPVPEFAEMLDGRLSMNEYVMTLDSGFPEFQRLMCLLLREMHMEGREIIQVEPYLETLLRIHECLAGGKTPEDIVRDPDLVSVYEAEKRATRALLTYYEHSVKAPFDEVIAAVKDFARADAERLVMRERLRAQAIGSLASMDADIYVEAGYIHYPLFRYLRRIIGRSHRVRVVYLLAPMVRRLKGRRRNMGPGDILTLHYALHGKLAKDTADVLAARSLIYIKLVRKDELIPGTSDAPHCEDEVRVNGVVDRLSVEDCRKLFDKIRLADRKSASRAVQAYLTEPSR